LSTLAGLAGNAAAGRRNKQQARFPTGRRVIAVGGRAQSFLCNGFHITRSAKSTSGFGTVSTDLPAGGVFLGKCDGTKHARGRRLHCSRSGLWPDNRQAIFFRRRISGNQTIRDFPATGTNLVDQRVAGLRDGGNADRHAITRALFIPARSSCGTAGPVISTRLISATTPFSHGAVVPRRCKAPWFSESISLSPGPCSARDSFLEKRGQCVRPARP